MLCPCYALLRLALPSLSCSMLCPRRAVQCYALPLLCSAALCLAVAVRICAMPCRCCAHLRCAMPLHCLATLRPGSAALRRGYALLRYALPLPCFAALCIALAQLISFWQYADFLSALARLPADLLRVKRLADRALLHLADDVPPFYSVGHCVSPLSTPLDGACRVFAPLGM